MSTCVRQIDYKRAVRVLRHAGFEVRRKASGAPMGRTVMLFPKQGEHAAILRAATLRKTGLL